MKIFSHLLTLGLCRYATTSDVERRHILPTPQLQAPIPDPKAPSSDVSVRYIGSDLSPDPPPGFRTELTYVCMPHLPMSYVKLRICARCSIAFEHRCLRQCTCASEVKLTPNPDWRAGIKDPKDSVPEKYDLEPPNVSNIRLEHGQEIHFPANEYRRQSKPAPVQQGQIALEETCKRCQILPMTYNSFCRDCKCDEWYELEWVISQTGDTKNIRLQRMQPHERTRTCTARAGTGEDSPRICQRCSQLDSLQCKQHCVCELWMYRLDNPMPFSNKCWTLHFNQFHPTYHPTVADGKQCEISCSRCSSNCHCERGNDNVMCEEKEERFHELCTEMCGYCLEHCQCG